MLISGGRHGVDGLSVLRGGVGVDLRGGHGVDGLSVLRGVLVLISGGETWC